MEKETYQLLEYEVILDERGDRKRVVAVSENKEKLCEYCIAKYGKTPCLEDNIPYLFSPGYDNYYHIIKSKIKIV